MKISDQEGVQIKIRSYHARMFLFTLLYLNFFSYLY